MGMPMNPAFKPPGVAVRSDARTRTAQPMQVEWHSTRSIGSPGSRLISKRCRQTGRSCWALQPPTTTLRPFSAPRTGLHAFQFSAATSARGRNAAHRGSGAGAGTGATPASPGRSHAAPEPSRIPARLRSVGRQRPDGDVGLLRDDRPMASRPSITGTAIRSAMPRWFTSPPRCAGICVPPTPSRGWVATSSP